MQRTEQTWNLETDVYTLAVCCPEAFIISFVFMLPTLHRQLKMEPEKQDKQTVVSFPAVDIEE